LTRLETEILRARGIIADVELWPILRAIAGRFHTQPQRNVGALREIIQPAILARYGLTALRNEPVLTEHIEMHDRKRRDWLARHCIGDATGDAMVWPQHDGAFGSTAGDFQLVGSKARHFDFYFHSIVV